MQTHHLSIQRTARFHTLTGPGPAREIWYVLHGYGQLAGRFLREFEHLVPEGRLIVAPEGLSRFYLRNGSGPVGASWMTREDRAEEIRDHVAYLDQLHGQLARELGGARVGVLGFSQGTAAAARWITRSRLRPARLVLWGGGLPPDLDDELAREALSRASVDLVAGDRDEILPPPLLEAEESRLRSLAPEVRSHRFRGGHRLDRELLARMLEPRADPPDPS